MLQDDEIENIILSKRKPVIKDHLIYDSIYTAY